jgi:hypothetical protein
MTAIQGQCAHHKVHVPRERARFPRRRDINISIRQVYRSHNLVKFTGIPCGPPDLSQPEYGPEDFHDEYFR